jgi:predicted alpha/beta-hydrolase family hydrolase
MAISYKSEVSIPVGSAQVSGELIIPEGARSIVLFAHGSGSSRFSPRNQMVADYLQQYGLGTLLFDLLTQEEDKDRGNRFNIELLAKRLVQATEWLQAQDTIKGLYYSYFGASTGAAAALIAASLKPQITAVVSRGGRPDLAIESLSSVKAPTLLIVGSRDHDVLKLNQKALEKISAEKRLAEVADATHLFEEPGTMEEVCRLAADWFTRHDTPVV